MKAITGAICVTVVTMIVGEGVRYCEEEEEGRRRKRRRRIRGRKTRFLACRRGGGEKGGVGVIQDT